MALIKKHIKQEVEELPTFSSLDSAVEYFESNDESGKKDYAIEEIAKFDRGAEYLISLINKEDYLDKSSLTKIASVVSNMDSEEAPIESIMELLKLDNAFVRNLGISILRDYEML